MARRAGPSWRAGNPATGLLTASLLLGCGTHSVADAKDAARRYAIAVEQRDADTVYAMLDEESQRALGRDGVARLLEQSHAELSQKALALRGDEVRVETEARVRFPNGEIVSLTVEAGQFRIDSAGALPSGAQTPTDALVELRAALARRSYPTLLYVLSQESRAALEAQVQSVVDALEHPETLRVLVEGSEAVVITPDGHRIELKNEDGIWKVQDFD